MLQVYTHGIAFIPNTYLPAGLVTGDGVTLFNCLINNWVNIKSLSGHLKPEIII